MYFKHNCYIIIIILLWSTPYALCMLFGYLVGGNVEKRFLSTAPY